MHLALPLWILTKLESNTLDYDIYGDSANITSNITGTLCQTCGHVAVGTTNDTNAGSDDVDITINLGGNSVMMSTQVSVRKSTGVDDVDILTDFQFKKHGDDHRNFNWVTSVSDKKTDIDNGTR